MGAWQMNKAHTYSYAVISYWTAYLKAHHPLEFAAANLRNAKDEDSALELLREMVREGIEFVAFDLEKSQMNWSVQDGKLYGGFIALKGIGESKAAKLIAARDAGTLTDKQRARTTITLLTATARNAGLSTDAELQAAGMEGSAAALQG